MADYQSEAVTVRFALESTRGTHPTSGWIDMQVDVGGVQGWHRAYTDVSRDIHSVNATLEKGDHVSYEVSPQIVHDTNKDFIDTFAEPAWRANAKALGSTGQSLFRPTAVVDGGGGEDSYTVASLGAIPNGVLIYARGFTNSANNGLRVTTGTSTGTAVKVATASLVAETPPANATLDVVGFQGAAGDLELDASGNLTSTALNFTTLGLTAGTWLYLPSAAEATAMGSALYAFSNAAYTGYARIVSVAANLITLERRSWTVGASTTETTSTVRVFVASRFYRNWPIDDTTNYDAATLSGEKVDIVPGTAASTRYTYVHGCGVNTLQIASPLNSKITATVGMVGMTATTPLAVADRKSGPSSSYAALATALTDSQNDIETVRLGDANGAMITEFNEWTFSLDNKITPKGVQGTFGAADLNYGKFDGKVSFQAYHSDSDVIDAVDENRDGMWFDVLVRNHQFGYLIDCPNVAVQNQDLTYAANLPVMISGDLMAYRSPTDGIAYSLSVFGYLPVS